jgi:hypothetical protein
VSGGSNLGEGGGEGGLVCWSLLGRLAAVVVVVVIIVFVAAWHAVVWVRWRGRQGGRVEVVEFHGVSVWRRPRRRGGGGGEALGRHRGAGGLV